MPNLGRCSKCGSKLSLGHSFEAVCYTCQERERQRTYTRMFCPKTGNEEMQYVVRESEDGITLRCGGCNKNHSHEIGRFAHLYQVSNPMLKEGEEAPP